MYSIVVISLTCELFLIIVRSHATVQNLNRSHDRDQGRIVHEAGEAEALGPGPSGPGPPDRPVQRKFTK